MPFARSARALIACAALAVAPAAAHAQFTVYTSLASFLAAVGANGTDTYTGFSITGTTASPITRTAGAYSYTASTPSNFFGAGTVANPWLSTNVATDAITFTGFTSTVRAIGGNFFGSNISGVFQAGNVTLTATNASGSMVQTLINANTSTFLGFVSTSAITSLVLAAVQPDAGFLWPTVDNLILAEAKPGSVVPEPSTYALLGTGLLFIGGIARRRRAC
jgi:PEP-CTERM motif